MQVHSKPSHVDAKRSFGSIQCLPTIDPAQSIHFRGLVAEAANKRHRPHGHRFGSSYLRGRNRGESQSGRWKAGHNMRKSLISSPHQKVRDCTRCRHLQSTQPQTGWHRCWKCHEATAGPSSSGGFHVELPCSQGTCTPWVFEHWGGCSSALSFGGNHWPKGSFFQSPPPGSSVGWTCGVRCWPDVLAPPSALVGRRWG